MKKGSFRRGTGQVRQAGQWLGKLEVGLAFLGSKSAFGTHHEGDFRWSQFDDLTGFVTVVTHPLDGGLPQVKPPLVKKGTQPIVQDDQDQSHWRSLIGAMSSEKSDDGREDQGSGWWTSTCPQWSQLYQVGI
jgi:hypothetical protein